MGRRLRLLSLGLALAAVTYAQPLALEPLPAIPLLVGDDAGPRALALADVSGDGVADLLAVDREDDALHVLLGVGDGTFREPVTYELEGTPTAVAAADVASPFASDSIGDVDGRVDIIVAHEDGFAEILLGRGDGGFDPPEQDLSDALDSLELIGVAVHDLDDNGRLDLVFLDGFDEVYFLCNEGGSFAPCLTDFVYTDGAGAVAMALGDFDGDTHVDVAVASRDSRDLRIVPGAGDGSFDETAVAILPISAGADAVPGDVATVEPDGDRGAELVVASGRQDGSGTLARIVRQLGETSLVEVAAPAALRALAVTDLDGDGAPDALAVSVAPAAPLALFPGDGAGGFGAPLTPAGTEALGAALTLITGSADGDDRADVVLLGGDGMAVTVALNRGGSAPCAGDCDGGGTVTINELLLGVNIAIGLQPVQQCAAFDADRSSSVEINELIAAVRNALEGCG